MVILSFDSHCLVDILNLEDGLGPRASASIIITPSTKMKASVILVALATTIQAAVDPDGGCTLLSLLPFSDGSIFTHRTRRSENDEAYGKYKRWTANTISMTGYTYSAAVLLAMDHFNNRDSSVVPEIAELPKNCSAFFTRNSKIVDDQLRDVRAGSEIVQSVSKSAPCAILGPFDAVSASWTSVITASVGIPQVFYTHVAQQVTEEDSFANTVRTSLSEQDYASKILSLLVHLGRNHLAVINGGGPYDRNFASTLRVQGRDFGVNVSLFPLVHESSSETTQQNAESVFKNVKESGIRTIFRIFNAVGPKELEKLSNAAEKYHLLEDGYLFVLEEKMAPVDDIAQIIGTQNVSSSLDSLLSGAIVVSPTEPWESGTDSMFLESWKTQNSSFVDRVNNLFPVPPDQPEYFQASSDFFQTTSPRRGAALVYDSVMAIGIGACNMNNSLPINESDSDTRYRNVRELEKFPALPHDNPLVNGIVNSKFTGATGRVAFGEPRIRAKDRTGNDVSYGAFNIRSVDQGGGLMRYEAVLVAKSALRDVWETVNGESFVYRYGKTVLKGPSQVVESNFLRNSIRAIGFTLMAIAWVVALGLSYAVWRWQDKPFVRAGQPVFLAILCVGSFLTSSSILTLSFDEDTGLSVSQLSVLCTVTPWLFFLGINTTFSGLFCKLWRVEQVTQFRRRQVKLIQAAWPLILLILSTVVCLVVWTVLDPFTWERETKNIWQFPPETYGACKSDNFPYYFVSLASITIVATLLALAMAWKTKDLNIDSRFSDANAVFLAIASQLQAWFVGLPVLAVLDKRSVEGTYIGRVLLIWIFALAPILLVIAPKVYRTWHANRNPDQKNQTSRVFISGLNDPTTSGSNLKNAKPIVKTSNGSGSAEGSGPKLHNNDDKEQALPCRVSANDAMVHFSKNSERLDV